nr:hypothetical protein CFP56_65246 [Quercus suber]
MWPEGVDDFPVKTATDDAFAVRYAVPVLTARLLLGCSHLQSEKTKIGRMTRHDQVLNSERRRPQTRFSFPAIGRRPRMNEKFVSGRTHQQVESGGKVSKAGDDG